MKKLTYFEAVIDNSGKQAYKKHRLGLPAITALKIALSGRWEPRGLVFNKMYKLDNR
jgi:hypothetical protein